MNDIELEPSETGNLIHDMFYSEKLTTPEQEILAARIDMYALLADMFRYPDLLARSFVRSGEYKEQVLRLARQLPFEINLGDEEEALLEYASSLTDDDVEAEFIRLFEAGPGNPPCPLIEGFHMGKEDGRLAIFKDLILFYNHFGLSYAEGASEERPDHLCYELEFIHYLAFLELKALQNGRETHGLRRAQKDFIGRHPAKWTGNLVSRMAEIVDGLREGVNRDVIEFYRNLIVLTDRFVTADGAYLKKLTEN
jgi:putative dimethyl sulfoxide reductase chaperone